MLRLVYDLLRVRGVSGFVPIPGGNTRGKQMRGALTLRKCAPTCVEQAHKIAEIVEVAATAVSFFIKALKLPMMRRTVPSPQVIGI